jgi:6-phosphofructokinase
MGRELRRKRQRRRQRKEEEERGAESRVALLTVTVDKTRFAEMYEQSYSIARVMGTAATWVALAGSTAAGAEKAPPSRTEKKRGI